MGAALHALELLSQGAGFALLAGTLGWLAWWHAGGLMLGREGRERRHHGGKLAAELAEAERDEVRDRSAI